MWYKTDSDSPWSNKRDPKIVMRLNTDLPVYARFTRGIRKDAIARVVDVDVTDNGCNRFIHNMTVTWDDRKKEIKTNLYEAELLSPEACDKQTETVWVYNSINNVPAVKPVDLAGRELTVGATIVMNAVADRRGMTLAFGRILEINKKGKQIVAQPFKLFGDEKAETVNLKPIDSHKLSYIDVPPFLESRKDFKTHALYRYIALIDKDTLNHLMLKKLGVN